MKSKHSKKWRYATTGAIIAGVVFALRNAHRQKNAAGKENKFNWKQFCFEVAGGALVGGAAGWITGYIKDELNEGIKPLNTDRLLLDIARTNVFSTNEKGFISLDNKAEILISLLEGEFAGMIRKPFRYGSTTSGLALKGSFDIDICMEVLPGAFRTIGDMNDFIETRLDNLVGRYGIQKIRRNSVSYGVYFRVQGCLQKIDVTPIRLSKKNGSSGFVYVHSPGLFVQPSRTKTDVRLLRRLQLSGKKRDILLLLKIWKEEEGLQLSSHLLQLLVLCAYEAYRGSIPRNETKKLILVLKYIADNIESIRVISPENTNNILTDRISSFEKYRIKNACLNVIEEYNYQPNSIVHFFDR